MDSLLVLVFLTPLEIMASLLWIDKRLVRFHHPCSPNHFFKTSHTPNKFTTYFFLGIRKKKNLHALLLPNSLVLGENNFSRNHYVILTFSTK